MNNRYRTFFNRIPDRKDMNGSAASIALIRHSRHNNDDGPDLNAVLFVANAGDSRTVLVQNDGSAVPLSTDHKPDRDDEWDRIEEAGGQYCTQHIDTCIVVIRCSDVGLWS